MSSSSKPRPKELVLATATSHLGRAKSKLPKPKATSKGVVSRRPKPGSFLERLVAMEVGDRLFFEISGNVSTQINRLRALTTACRRFVPDSLYQVAECVGVPLKPSCDALSFRFISVLRMQ